MYADRKSIFVSGHKGFLGNHLVSSLQNIYDIKTFSGDLFGLSPTDFDGSERVFFHFAGLSTPSLCEEKPDLAYRDNVELVEKLINSLHLSFAQAKTKFVFFSSAHVYAQSKDKLNEESPLNPRSVYAKSKLAAEAVVSDLCTRYKIPYLIIRLFNTSHYSQEGPYFMPEVYLQLKENYPEHQDKPLKTGPLNIVRDFLAIQDFLQAMSLISKRAMLDDGFPTGVYNVSSGVGKDLRDIVRVLRAEIGYEIPISLDRADASSTMVGCSNLFQNNFNWKPSHSSNAEIFVKNFLAEI